MNDREYTLKRAKDGRWIGFTFDMEVPACAVGETPTEVVKLLDRGEGITREDAQRAFEALPTDREPE